MTNSHKLQLLYSKVQLGSFHTCNLSCVHISKLITMTCILSHDNCLFSVVKLCHRFCAVDCDAVRRVMGVVFSLPLSQYHSRSLIPDQRNIIWSSRRGFTIRSPTFFYIGLFFCQTTGDKVRHQSRRYFVHRIGQQALSAPLYKSRVNMYVCINGFCAKSLIFYFFCLSE